MKVSWVSPCGTIKLYLSNCMDMLHHVTGDLLSTDPPYGIKHRCNYKTGKTRPRGRERKGKCFDYPNVFGDDKPFDPSPLLQLNLPTILWGANYYANLLPPSPSWLVWDKKRPDTASQATCELAWTNCVKGVRRFAHLWNGCMRASERGEHYHPTQKPVALFTWLLGLKWTRGFKTIIDPYMGAGPQAVACILSGRNYIGMEIVPGYFNIAVSRCKAAFTKREEILSATKPGDNE